MALRLLLVDDCVEVRSLLKRLLDGNGITVVGEACDGYLAIDAVRYLKPDVVLMDYQMPLMDGLAAAGHILADPCPPAIVLLTSDPDQQLRRAAKNLGIAVVLEKGIESMRIREVLFAMRTLLQPVSGHLSMPQPSQ